MPSDSALVVSPQPSVALSDEANRFLPVMSLEVAGQRRKFIVDAVAQMLRPGIDFGVIPGTKSPTLLNPGAEKLNNLFGLVPTFEILEQDLDWTGQRHNGEMFIFYATKCRLMRGPHCMGEGDGSASSWESKYRYRKAERTCPACGKENIRKSKPKPDGTGGGWYCWQKTGGCGATFAEGDRSIESQQSGNKPNPDIADVANTILKMANKRAKIAATLNALSAHEFFTQDVEDYPPPQEPTSASGEEEPQQQEPRRAAPPPTVRQAPPPPPPQEEEHVPLALRKVYDIIANGNREDTLAQFRQFEGFLFETLGEAGGEMYREVLGRHGVEHPGQLKSLGRVRNCMRDVWELCAAHQPKAAQ